MKRKSLENSLTSSRYEVHFPFSSNIQEVPEDGSIQSSVAYQFVPIDQLPHCAPNSLVDVIGLVKAVNEVVKFHNQKLGNKIVFRQDLLLVDQTQCEIRCCVFSDCDEPLAVSDNCETIVALRRVKLVEFGGLSLNFTSSSSMEINPDVEQAADLQVFRAHNTVEGFAVQSLSKG